MGFPHYSSGGSSGIVASGTLQIGTAADLYLVRDAANALAQRNGTNAQSFRVYNTFTDASNYERGVFDWLISGNDLAIGTAQAGTGVARSVIFLRGGTTQFSLDNGFITFSQHHRYSADNLYDIGAAGATRPRNLHFGGYLAGAVQALSGVGAVNLTTQTTAFTSTGAAQALTLADGVVGQLKEIVHVVDGGSGVLTPTNLFNGTTITFTNLGDSVILRFIGTEWHIIAINGATLGA